MHSQTFGNGLFWRGFVENGECKPAVENTKKFARVYRLDQVNNQPPMKFLNISGNAFNTIGSNDFSLFEDVAQLVQEEPNSAMDPETLGLLASMFHRALRRRRQRSTLSNNDSQRDYIELRSAN